MLLISGRQFHRTKRFYIWLAVVLLLFGFQPAILLTMILELKRGQVET
jgi:hypothetical protein